MLFVLGGSLFGLTLLRLIITQQHAFVKQRLFHFCQHVLCCEDAGKDELVLVQHCNIFSFSSTSDLVF